MTILTRTPRHQAATVSRIVAHNLRTAASRKGLSVRDLRSIERGNHIPAGRLFLALAGIGLTVTHMFVLQAELGLDVSQIFAGTTRNQGVQS